MALKEPGDFWSEYIAAAGVDEQMAEGARNAHRLDIVA